MQARLLEKFHKQRFEAEKAGLWEQWGIVINPVTYQELLKEAYERVDAMPISFSGGIDYLYGLRVIVRNFVPDEEAYIVDEQFGRWILQQPN